MKRAKKSLEIVGTASVVQGPLSLALHILPPLGESIEDKKSFDRTLVDFLNVSICRIQGDNCIPVASLHVPEIKRRTGFYQNSEPPLPCELEYRLG